MRTVVATITLLLVSLAGARAQDETSTPESAPPSVEDLLALIQEQRQLLDAQVEQITKLESRLDEVETLTLSSFNRLQEIEEKPAEATVSTAIEERLAGLEQSVEKIPEIPTDLVEAGAFPGSFRIPGTDAALRIGGQVRMSVVKTLGPLGIDDRFVTSLIPIEGSQEAGRGSRLTYSAQPSRLNFDMRAPTGVGSMRAFIEADYAGRGDTFRLRHAYGQWSGFLAGQTWSTFSDPEAEPDGIDFEGLNAISLFRQPQIRYTHELMDGVNLAVAIENPSPDVTGATGVNQIPDTIARIRFTPGERAPLGILKRGGHIQIGVIGRQIRAEPLDRPNETLATGGFGYNVSGKVFAPWNRERDNVTFASYGGKGMGRYITDLGTLGGQDAVYDPVTDTLEALGAFSGYVGYQHWWSQTIRSTFTYGYVNVSNLDSQDDGALNQTNRFTLNLAWSPVPRIDVVFEYLSGIRSNKDGNSGWSNQLQFGGTFRF